MLTIAFILFMLSLISTIGLGVTALLYIFEGEFRWNWILPSLLSLFICITAGNYSETITDIYYISSIEEGAIGVFNGDREIKLIASIEEMDLGLRDSVKVTSIVKALSIESKLISIEKIELLKTGE